MCVKRGFGKNSKKDYLCKNYTVMGIWTKIQRAWYFYCVNPTLRKWEEGGFKFKFRRFFLDIRSISGNFKMRWTASEHPYGYLFAGENDQTEGFANRMYMIGALLTTDQQFVTDIDKALEGYQKRMDGQANVVEDETEEKIAIEEVKAVQEYVDAPKKERRKMERDANGRFKKAVKDVQKGANGDL